MRIYIKEFRILTRIIHLVNKLYYKKKSKIILAEILANTKSQTGLFSGEKPRFTIREREITGKESAKSIKAQEILGGKTFFLIKDNFSRGKSYKRTKTSSGSSSGARKTRRSSVFRFLKMINGGFKTRF